MSPGSATSPDLVASPSLPTSPDLHYPSADSMDVDPVPTVASLPLDSPSFAYDVTGAAPSPPSDLDFATTDLNSDDLSPPGPGHLPPHNEHQQPPPDPPTIQDEFLGVLSHFPIAPTIGSFNIEGVHGNFINKATIQYWENIIGGDKWVRMVQSQ